MDFTVNKFSSSISHSPPLVLEIWILRLLWMDRVNYLTNDCVFGRNYAMNMFCIAWTDSFNLTTSRKLLKCEQNLKLFFRPFNDDMMAQRKEQSCFDNEVYSDVIGFGGTATSRTFLLDKRGLRRKFEFINIIKSSNITSSVQYTVNI